MCGIAGQFGNVEEASPKQFVDSMAHRGPDGHGVWQSLHASLVHTRLAILDLTEAGAQPMIYHESEAGKSVLVFNGEIYNHVELRRELEAAGESFSGHSDTEVLLRILIREGEAAIPRLAGMFAFAFWDEDKGEALLARDSFGIKPLYYRYDDESLCFASESRCLKRSGDVVDPDALRDFFLWGSVPEPQTIFSPIRQIPAGHLLKWRSGTAEIKRWQHSPPRVSAGISWETTVKQTRTALEETIKRHLVADVPIGLFLSGGIDSTAVLALTRKVLGSDADIRTFSIGFSDPAFDESSVAQRTAEHFGTHHTEWLMDERDGAAEIAAFLESVDQPTIDGFNTWCVSKLTRRHGIKVALSGLGGDEWFAGYKSFERVPKLRRLHKLLGPLRSPVGTSLANRRPGSPWRRLGAFLLGGGTWLEAFHAQRGIFTPEEANSLVESIAGKSPGRPIWDIEDLPDHNKAIVSHLELTRYMRNQLLRDSDVFAMAHGIEIRVPFVDGRLGDFLATLPPKHRLKSGKKLLLAAVPEIPEWVREQPKRGFRFPFHDWVEGEFGDLLAHAKHVSPIPLVAWYRIWAVAIALKTLDSKAP